MDIERLSGLSTPARDRTAAIAHAEIPIDSMGETHPVASCRDGTSDSIAVLL